MGSGFSPFANAHCFWAVVEQSRNYSPKTTKGATIPSARKQIRQPPRWLSLSKPPARTSPRSKDTKTSGLKWKYESDTEYGLYCGGKDGQTTSSFAKSIGLLKIVVAKNSLLTVKVSGNSDTLTKNYVVLTTSSATSTANTLAVLGLIGTGAATSDDKVATAEIADEKIKITSVGAGDGLGGKVELTVATDTNFEAASKVSKDNAASVTFDGLAAGSYIVRYAATDDYAASTTTAISVGDATQTATTGTWTLTTLLASKTFSGKKYTGTNSPNGATSNATTSQSTIVGTSAAYPDDFTPSDTQKGSEPKAISFKLHANMANDATKTDEYGLCIKKDALKIAGVKGSVKLTVGDTTALQTVNKVGTSNETKGKMDNYEVTFDGGAAGKDVYIGASNEVYISKITIAAQ